MFLRDRSLFIVQGGPEEKLRGAFKFFKTRNGGGLKKYRETKEGLMGYIPSHG